VTFSTLWLLRRKREKKSSSGDAQAWKGGRNIVSEKRKMRLAVRRGVEKRVDGGGVCFVGRQGKNSFASCVTLQKRETSTDRKKKKLSSVRAYAKRF